MTGIDRFSFALGAAVGAAVFALGLFGGRALGEWHDHRPYKAGGRRKLRKELKRMCFNGRTRKRAILMKLFGLKRPPGVPGHITREIIRKGPGDGD